MPTGSTEQEVSKIDFEDTSEIDIRTANGVVRELNFESPWTTNNDCNSCCSNCKIRKSITTENWIVSIFVPTKSLSHYNRLIIQKHLSYFAISIVWNKNQTLLTSLAPSLHWVWISLYWVWNVERAPKMATRFVLQWLIHKPLPFMKVHNQMLLEILNMDRVIWS